MFVHATTTQATTTSTNTSTKKPTAFEEIEEELTSIIADLKNKEDGDVVHIRPKTPEELAQYG